MGSTREGKIIMAFVEVTCGNGRPIEELSKLIEKRSKWLNETAEQSCTACMLDILVSLRALTTVAKPSKKEIDMLDTSLVPSFTGGRKAPQFCLRYGGVRYTPRKDERVRIVPGVVSKDFKNCHVWEWHDINKRVWLIVARSRADAINWAFNKIKKRA